MTTLGGERMTTSEEEKRPWFQYKDLVIGFTTEYKWIWNDKGSGGYYNGSYWRPKVPQDMTDFHPIGYLGNKGYDDVNGKKAIAVVKDANGPAGTALCLPKDFHRVWRNKESGGGKNGSMWRPIPPEGYVALGLVCNVSWNKPSLDCVRCVRSDLVVPAMPGDLIWSDKDTGSVGHFGSWGIKPPAAPAGEVYLSPGTFIGDSSYTKPEHDPNAYALRVPIPQKSPPSPTPPLPVLHSFSRPAPFEEDTVSYRSILPWFAVNDPNLTSVDQLLQSPYYSLERVDRYMRIGHNHNNTSETQEAKYEFAVGTSGSEQTTFSVTTSIELGGEWGVEGSKFSAKLALSFTHSVASTKGWSQAETRTIDAKIAPGTAVAVYAIQSTYRLFRASGEQVSIDVPYTPNTADSIYWTQYPPVE